MRIEEVKKIDVAPGDTIIVTMGNDQVGRPDQKQLDQAKDLFKSVHPECKVIAADYTFKVQVLKRERSLLEKLFS